MVKKTPPPPKKGNTYVCSMGCGYTSSSYTVVSNHENGCNGQPPPDRHAPVEKGPR